MPLWLRILAVVLLLILGRSVYGQDSATVRLGFVLSFARYVDWPGSVLKPEAPFRICFAPGDSNMTGQIGDLLQQSVRGRIIQVKLPLRPAEAEGCQVLYLPADLPLASLRAWLDIATKSGSLTVSELPDFIETGGMIGLISIGSRYRFDINLGAARQADLRISPYLLKLARTVK